MQYKPTFRSQGTTPSLMDVHLLDLPEHVLHDAFQYLDTWSLCQAAQTCRLFLRLAGLHLGTANFLSSYLVGQTFVRFIDVRCRESWLLERVRNLDR